MGRSIPPRMALLTALMTVFALGVVALGPAQAAPRTSDSAVAQIEQVVGDGQVLDGTFTATRFVNDSGVLTVLGTFTGTLDGVPVSDTTRAAVDLASSTGTCEILNLVLGPLELDLLGLVIELNQVELVITAEQGPGNLLGNLLCAVAGLLDGPTGLGALVDQIVRLLNRVLGAL